MEYWRWGYAPYVSVAEKRARAARAAAKLVKKGGKLEPVSIDGRKIAREWWGQAWCRNLERYADYSNRIGRGRSYVSHGMVLDLKIAKGEISALVAGSRSTPYKVGIKITRLSPKDWKNIIAQTEGRIDSVQALLHGAFPRELEGLFMEQKQGLFPSPRQISFSCSCPDWASMCKHVAAALYGTGARLDARPELFFTLRGVDMNNLVGKAVEAETGRLLKKAKKTSGRKLALNTADMSELFGIEIGGGAAGAVTGASKGKKDIKKSVVKTRIKKTVKKIRLKKVRIKKSAGRKPA